MHVWHRTWKGLLAMLGIDDPYVWSAYLLCIASTLACVIYGLATWNRGDEPVIQEDVRWAAEEKEIEKEL
jgi:heme exporter protein D